MNANPEFDEMISLLSMLTSRLRFVNENLNPAKMWSNLSAKEDVIKLTKELESFMKLIPYKLTLEDTVEANPYSRRSRRRAEPSETKFVLRKRA